MDVITFLCGIMASLKHNGNIMSKLQKINDMNDKVNFVNDVIGECSSLNITDFRVMTTLFKKSFLSIQFIADELDLDEYEILGSLTKMQNSVYDLVKFSNDKIYLTERGDEVFEKAAMVWFETTFPDKTLAGGKEKRPITEMMEQYKNIVYGIFEDDVRPAIVSRQNYKIKFHNMKSGFKMVELRNDGKLRIWVSKNRADLIEEFSAYDGVRILPPSEKAYVYKFDINCDEQILKTVCESIKPRLN